MAEVLFYHLTESSLEEALPPLLVRSVARGWRCVVQTGSDERCAALDEHLWTFSDESFLAHGTAREGEADRQPVWLTTGADNPNNATVRFLVDGALPPPLAAYQRAVFLFDGHDNVQVEAARAQWRDLKSEGHALTYWQQSADRRWERKA